MKNPTALVNDALSRLGSNASAEVTGYAPTPRSDANYTLVRGVNPNNDSGREHSQLGDLKGSTIWDPGYKDIVSIETNRRYRSIIFTE